MCSCFCVFIPYTIFLRQLSMEKVSCSSPGIQLSAEGCVSSETSVKTDRAKFKSVNAEAKIPWSWSQSQCLLTQRLLWSYLYSRMKQDIYDIYYTVATPIICLSEVKCPCDLQFDDLSEEKITGIGATGSQWLIPGITLSAKILTQNLLFLQEPTSGFFCQRLHEDF